LSWGLTLHLYLKFHRNKIQSKSTQGLIWEQNYCF